MYQGATPHGISEWPRFWARHATSRPALVFEGRTITWGELEDRVARLAGGLRATGVEKGDRVGFLCRNTPEFYEVLLACARIGAVFVPFNTRLSHGEMNHIAADSDLSLLVTERHFSDRLTGPLADVDRIHFLDAPHGGAASYEDLLGEPVHRPTDVTLDDLLILVYTSGTTGLAKAAMITHRNAVATAVAVINADGIGPTDRVLLPAPLAFAGSVLSVSMPMLQAGASIAIERSFDPERTLDLVERGGVTMLKLVPVIYQMMAASPTFHERDFSGLRTATSGGAPVPLDIIQTYQARGVGLASAYGLTEGSGYNLGLPAEQAEERVGWSGFPLPFQEARIVDEEGKEKPHGEVGELVLRGPNIMVGYWRAPEATAEALRDGWLHTGDLALRDEEGYFKVVDRKKDMIISGGINVYPAEVERVLRMHPAVLDVAVVGVPDEKWGESPLAYVVSADPGLTLEELNAATSSELADYKRPRHLVLLDELPRNTNGKLLKRALRELANSPA